jgi:SAM-dependent methyltransferase
MNIQHLPYQIEPQKNRSAFYENYWKLVSLRLLCRHVEPKGKTLLDYGCGRGEALQYARDLGFEPSGTDLDPECVRLSNQYGPATLLNADEPVSQFGRGSFDVVACFHVLEHVDNPKKTLSDLAAIARQYVVLAVPNLHKLYTLFRRRFELAGFNPGHLQSWDHLHLRNLAERHCGLELVEWGFDATWLPLVSDVAGRLLGNKATIRLETGLFLRLFPFHCISVIGLFKVKRPLAGTEAVA